MVLEFASLLINPIYVVLMKKGTIASFGMRSGCVRDGLVSDGQVKRTRFAFQKDSFYLAKGLVLDCKRTRFEGQNESFSEC